jgi:bacteriophage N4 adsorption protein A
MKIITSTVAVLMATAALASAQQVELGSDLSGYRRFLVYPHLQQGWESMQRGERDGALAEFEQARRLAPENTAIALQLAAAYRKFGDAKRAESTLRAQLERTPDDARLRNALAELRAAAPHPAEALSARACTDRTSSSCRNATPADPSTALRASPSTTLTAAPRPGAPARTADAKTGEQPTGPRRQRAETPAPSAQQPATAVTQPETAPELSAALIEALRTRRFDVAERQADFLLARDPGRAGLFDEVTYKLVEAGAAEQAAHVLMRAYPFAGETAAQRIALYQRLGMLLEQRPAAFSDDQLSRLREPLDTPALRSQQAALWASLRNCSAVRIALADLSPEYSYDDWMRLGDCSEAEDSALARNAYARAHTQQPGGRGSRALGYSAYAGGDYRTALEAWRSVGAESLSADDLLAAVTTALAAGEQGQAGSWLTQYRQRGNALDRHYWSLLAQSYGDDDAAAATTALEHAVDLGPDLNDYLRLARLARSPDQEAHWLERAADLDRANAFVQLQLAYAYTRAGRGPSALKALEAAAAIAPDNMTVQVELGFAYWRAGNPVLAQRALERAWRADPSNAVLAQQLVFVAQRLKQNETARWYAEQVLDAPAAFSDAPTEGSATPAERRFGFQRLHEDLGRRVTVNLDGFSGTRVGTTASAPQIGSGYRSYSQLEAAVRLGNPPIRDGSELSAYARVFGDGGNERRPVPVENAMLGVGLRWKPWRNQVIYLDAENQIGLDDHTRKDVLLRASASFFNGGRHSDDWHPGDGWLSRNLYLDAARYLQSDYSAVTADYRMSYHRKIATKQTLEPYGHFQANGARYQHIDRDLRAGLGVRWNIWYAGTQYDADPHKLTLGLEFQQAFETYLPDRNGVFVTLGSRW